LHHDRDHLTQLWQLKPLPVCSYNNFVLRKYNLWSELHYPD
jgi:hypothetical protein